MSEPVATAVPPRTAVRVRLALPGLAVAAVAAGVGWLVNGAVGWASPLVVAIVLGVAMRAVGGYRAWMSPGLGVAARPVLRAGVVLLGLQLALADVVHAGHLLLAVVLVSVAAAFLVTWRVARWLGLTPARSLVVATGVSICGASAVAAMNQVADGDEEDAVAAVTAVTVLGTLCLLLMPAANLVLGLDEVDYGRWTGASVHEVGQVVAIAGAAGAAALPAAVMVKLFRVLLLAPLIALVSAARRRASRDGARPPLVPWFVAGFLAMAGLRATGWLPGPVLHIAAAAASLLLAAAMFALGAAVDVKTVVRRGGPTLLAGAAGSVLLAGLSLAGLRLLG